MPIAKTIKQYLDNKHVIYSVLEVPHFDSPYQAANVAKLPPGSLYYPVVLRDPFGLIMAVLPASHRLDLRRLAGVLRRSIEPAFQTQLSSVFADCQAGHFPPLGEAYGIRTIIDASLTTPETVYIVAGDHGRLIKLSRKDFMLLQTNAWLGSDFTAAIEEEYAEFNTPQAGDEKPALIRDRIEQITELPAMPEMATRMFQLRANPAADVADLVAVVEQDPSLAAQVMRYANSPFFGYRGKIETLQVAIGRVLGFDMVMNLALGLSLAQPFKVPGHGPIGLKTCWSNAVYSASIMQLLCKAMPAKIRPRVGTCYLIGLLHDFGYLILGHLFREEFVVLNDLIEQDNTKTAVEIERDFLGMDHCELGGWLLQAWNFPDELAVAVREHHNDAYIGPQAIYVKLIQLTTYLLKAYESGVMIDEGLPKDAVTALGFDEDQLMLIMSQVMESDESLKNMARRLAA